MKDTFKYLVLWAIMMLATSLQAQTNGSNSSYSRFGLGTLADQSQGFNRGMGSTGIGIRLGNRVNLRRSQSLRQVSQRRG